MNVFTVILQIISLLAGIWIVINLISLFKMMFAKPQSSDVQTSMMTSHGLMTLSDREDEAWVLKNELYPFRLCIAHQKPSAEYLTFLTAIAEDFETIRSLVMKVSGVNDLINPTIVLFQIKAETCYFDVEFENDGVDEVVKFTYDDSHKSQIF